MSRKAQQDTVRVSSGSINAAGLVWGMIIVMARHNISSGIIQLF